MNFWHFIKLLIVTCLETRVIHMLIVTILLFANSTTMLSMSIDSSKLFFIHYCYFGNDNWTQSYSQLNTDEFILIKVISLLDVSRILFPGGRSMLQILWKNNLWGEEWIGTNSLSHRTASPKEGTWRCTSKKIY